MKKYLTLISLFLLCTFCIFYGFRMNKVDEAIPKGDEPYNEEDYQESLLVLNGTVDDRINTTENISELQTDYIKYNKGLLTFSELTDLNITNLKSVSNFPFNPLPNYLFSTGFYENSGVQVYYQSNNELTKTVVYRVTLGEKKNEVDIIYEGDYLKLVSVNTDNLEVLNAYNSNHDLVMIEVF